MERLLGKLILGIRLVRDGKTEDHWINEKKLSKLRMLGINCSNTFNDDEDENDVLNGYIIFATPDKQYVMCHYQEGIEDVYIDDINGDLFSLVGQIVTQSEEVSNYEEDPVKYRIYDSYHWTFYKLASIKGYIDIKWFSGSDGCYSEKVDLYEIEV